MWTGDIFVLLKCQQITENMIRYIVSIKYILESSQYSKPDGLVLSLHSAGV